MDANEIKPCPFCSSPDVSQDTWSVKCLACGAEMPGDVDRAREAWNRRDIMDACAAEITKILAAV